MQLAMIGPFTSGGIWGLANGYAHMGRAVRGS